MTVLNAKQRLALSNKMLDEPWKFKKYIELSANEKRTIRDALEFYEKYLQRKANGAPSLSDKAQNIADELRRIVVELESLDDES